MVPVTVLLEEYGEERTSEEVLRRARCTKCGFQRNDQMRLLHFGKSVLVQIRSAIKCGNSKEVEVYWYLLLYVF